MDDDTVYLLTTVDNPFNPWTHFDEWEAYDRAQGHNTLAYLGRVVVTAAELSDYDRDVAEREAIDRIVDQNLLGLYKKVPDPRAS